MELSENSKMKLYNSYDMELGEYFKKEQSENFLLSYAKIKIWS